MHDDKQNGVCQGSVINSFLLIMYMVEVSGIILTCLRAYVSVTLVLMKIIQE